MQGEQDDIVDRATRSRMMRAVRHYGTTPEQRVRGIVRDLGFRFATNLRVLPGSPDLASRQMKWAVFVHGCFWHGHQNCSKTKGGEQPRIPRSNSKFWLEKIQANRRRDALKARRLRRLGFRVLNVWECELRNRETAERRIARFLGALRDAR
jgi:DNA mismatch endonuclease (patch repair protein)